MIDPTAQEIGRLRVTYRHYCAASESGVIRTVTVNQVRDGVPRWEARMVLPDGIVTDNCTRQPSLAA